MTEKTAPKRHQGRPGVHSLDHFSLTVPDLDEAGRFFTAFGLSVRPEDGGLGLYAAGAHRWALLVQGTRKALGHLCFGAFAEDLPAIAERVRKAGAEIGSGDEGLWCRDPDGNRILLRVGPKVSPDTKTGLEALSAASGQRGATGRSGAAQVRPRRLSHLLLFSADVSASIRFYTEVLGLRLSDHSGDIIAFLHGPHGSDHHMIAFAKSAGPGYHHSSWDVASVDQVGQGAAQMDAAGHTAGWGLGRHVLGSNYFHYVRDPWGSYAEYSADIDHIGADCDWPAGDHPPEDSLYNWGPPPPPDFVTNHELDR
jgi:catechol 2,3-dioxygenase-like lactoylglutathione lyase family enzyme